jgi:hypothetical protein
MREADTHGVNAESLLQLSAVLCRHEPQIFFSIARQADAFNTQINGPTAHG